ncbi:ribonuclease R [Mycoplasmatota bacterium zrk1]
MKERLLELITKPTTIEELKNVLAITDASNFKLLVKSLNELEDEGYLVINGDYYDLAINHGVYIGELTINKKGFGFLETESLKDDIYIPKSDLSNAMHRDKVLVKVTRDKGHGLKTEGKVIRILERKNEYIIGTFIENRDNGYVKPDDSIFAKRIQIVKKKSLGAVTNHKVRVKIVDYFKDLIKGEVVEILGHKNDPGMDILSIVYKHHFRPEFPKEVLKEIEDINEVSEYDLDNRVDLRDKLFITIDGADAKDLDDAVCLERKGENFVLSVSIADVSYYVKEDSKLDKEALKRSTSVYLVDRVIPMIPHKLSNGICSLNPNVDRLTLTCEMELDKHGTVINHDIYQSVINSKYRMTYTEVNDILKGDKETQTKYANIVSLFYDMNRLAKVLNSRRSKRGSINFETNEPKILVDETGFPIEIFVRDREDSEKLIEEFMLVANETVAEHFHWLNYPFIYRVHEEPNEDKLKNLFKLTGMLGFKVKGTTNSVHPSALQDLLKSIEGLPEERVINTLMLRSMAKAKYSNQSLGHYGLASKFYTHFTSPIRRYPDLMVHRLIREFIINENVDRRSIKHYDLIMPEIANQTSKKERDAVNCERDVDSMKMAEYMIDKVGQEFEGIVSSVTSFGMFVEVDRAIEGLVHINDMKDDYYEYHQDRYILVGRRSKKVYTIGDKVKIKCINANKEEAKIDFELISGKERRARRTEGERNAQRRGKNNRSKQKSKT